MTKTNHIRKLPDQKNENSNLFIEENTLIVYCVLYYILYILKQTFTDFKN